MTVASRTANTPRAAFLRRKEFISSSYRTEGLVQLAMRKVLGARGFDLRPSVPNRVIDHAEPAARKPWDRSGTATSSDKGSQVGRGPADLRKCLRESASVHE